MGMNRSLVERVVATLVFAYALVLYILTVAIDTTIIINNLA